MSHSNQFKNLSVDSLKLKKILFNNTRKKIILSIILAFIINIIVISFILIKSDGNNEPQIINQNNILQLASLTIIITIIYSSMIFIRCNQSVDRVRIVLLIIASSILFLLPKLSEYFFYGRYDQLSHLGTIISIIENGHFSTTNFYPLSHIWASEISLLINVNPIIVMGFFPWYCSIILFFSSLYLLLKITNNDKEVSLIASLISFIPIVGATQALFMPVIIGIVIVPFMVALLFDQGANKKIILILFILMMPMMHPMVIIFIIIFLIILHLLSIVCDEEKTKKLEIPNIITLSLAAFISWMVGFYIFVHSTKNFISVLSGGAFRSIAKTSNQLSQVDFTIQQFFTIIIILMGALLCMYILLFNSIFSVIKINNIVLKNKILMYSIFAGNIVIVVLCAIGVFDLTFTRGLYFILCITPIIVFTSIIMKKKSNTIIYKIVGLFLIIGLLIAPFGLYPGQAQLAPNEQVTIAEYAGYAHFGPYLMSGANITSFGESHRFIAGTMGIDKTSQFTYGIYKRHFVDENEELLGFLSNNETILIVSNHAEEMYTMGAWSATNNFYNTDFIKLRNAPTVDIIYSNDDLYMGIL